MNKAPHCPICASTYIFELYRPSSDYGVAWSAKNTPALGINKCKECSVVFTWPLIPILELKDYYSTEDYFSYQINKNHSNSFRRRLRNRVLRDHFGYGKKTWSAALTYPLSLPLRHFPMFKKGGKLLEVGCGVGNYLASVKELGWTVSGLEINHDAASIALSRDIGDITIADAESLPYRDNEFDVVVLFHVFEHIPHPKNALSEFRRVLKSDGTLILGVPNFSSFASRVAGPYWAGLGLPLHYYHFTLESLSTLLSKEGFNVIRYSYANIFDDTFGQIVEIFHSAILHKPMSPIAKQLQYMLSRFGSILDYIIGNAIANFFHCGSQVTIVATNSSNGTQ